MAEEEFNYLEEGRRIARTYLSKHGWAREWRRTLNRQLYPEVNREEFEAKERQCDQMEEEAEEIFSREYDRWRHESSLQAREVFRGIYEIMGRRTDLGFIAKRIVERIKREFSS
jgi:hypothetical protein